MSAERIAYLAGEIIRHDRLYWRDKAPEISDQAYDSLCEELRSLDPNHPVLNRIPEAPGTVEHPVPMLSLGKCYSQEEAISWAQGVARGPEELFGVSTKWDGCAARLDEDDYGVVTGVYSRGDGYQGEDWSHAIRIIGFPYGASDRGEIIVTKSTFKEVREKIADLVGRLYKNPRAMASGLLNNRSLPKDFPKVLTFVPYSYDEGAGTLEDLCNGDWENTIADAQAHNHPADGLVIRLMDEAYAESLGVTDHHPRHSVALKFKNPTGKTVLVDVLWQCGKGKISPVGIVKPCEISGTTTTRCTLHNMNIISQKGVNIGDEIELEKCGDVIPGLARVIAPGPDRQPIRCEACPACGGKPMRVDNGWKCTNEQCPGTAGKKLHDALVRLGVENIGPGTVAKLIERGRHTVDKVLEMEEIDWLGVEGFGKVSARKAALELQRVCSQPMDDYRILAALNIHGVGLTLSKQILDKMSLAELRLADMEKLSELPGIGPIRAHDIYHGLADNSALIFSLLLQCRQIVETKGQSSRPTVVFTGKSERSRDDWFKFARSHGYEPLKGVVKKLSYLVTNSPESNTTKMKKARQYGVNIITYEEFEAMVNSN